MTQQPAPQPAQTLEQLLDSRQEQLKLRFPVPPPAPPRRARALPALGIAVLLGGGLWWADPAYRHEQFVTATDARRTLALADGSQVVLDKDSRLAVSWHLFSRRVDLQAGQALFDISHARYRPFVVSAGAVDVKVLGTRFNVLRLDAQHTQVTLERGSVQVIERQATGSVTPLQPGEQAAFNAGHLARLSQVRASDASAWQDDRLVFHRTPLDEALRLINRYRVRPVRLADPALGQLSVNGVFDSRETDKLLALLPGVLPVRLVEQTDGTQVLQRK